MKYIVAVSGGVDSVVLLHMMSKRLDVKDIIVAHFDHGIRGEVSHQDAEFVKQLSQIYGVYYISEQGNLSKNTSEAEARDSRYAFLRRIATQFNGQIVTAHHQDDMIETIAINLTRGTSWRGTAVFDSESIRRPLIHKTKQQLYDYALRHSLEWVEDASNASDDYLRNRIRKRMYQLPIETRNQLVALRNQQVQNRRDIDIHTRLIGPRYDRYFYIVIDHSVAIELLKRLTNERLLTAQIERLLLMIKVARAGAIFEPGAQLRVEFGLRDFSIKNTSELLY